MPKYFKMSKYRFNKLIPRLARHFDIRRFYLPFSFGITKQGIAFLFSVSLLSLAAINSGNNLLFLILSTMLSVILVSGIAARASLRSLSLSLQVPENVFAGETVSIKISLTNTKAILPSFSITVEDMASRKRSPVFSLAKRIIPRRGPAKREGVAEEGAVMRHSAYFPSLRPRETRSELVVQSFPRRGKYRFTGFRVSTQFPFGLFRRGERVQAEGETLVYPRIHEVAAYYHLLPFMPGKRDGLRVGHGESLHSIRQHRDGESARIVDWKATAKTGRLMAKEFAREEESKFCLILDSLLHPCAGKNGGEKFERAVSLAASLATHFCAQGTELEFISPQEHVSKGIGSDHLFRILRSLAVVECRPAPPDEEMDFIGELSRVVHSQALDEILSPKIFKIIITSRPRGNFPATIWRSSHVIYFDEL